MSVETLTMPSLYQGLTLFTKSPATSRLKPFIARSESGNIINLTLPSKNFEDGAEAISYKEGFVNGNPPTSGCCLTNYHIIHKRLKAAVPIQDNYTGQLLLKTPDNKWVIYDVLSASFIAPQPNVAYSFVTMPDKTIRITASAQGVHALNSNLAPYVRYAGEVQFDEQQQIKMWTNNSGSYQPSASLACQSGLDCNSFYDYSHQEHANLKIN